MKKQQLYEIYSFGYNYSILKRGLPTRTQSSARASIIEFIGFLDSLGLRVTRIAAIPLENLCDTLSETSAEKLTEAKCMEIEAIVAGLDVTLDCELQTKHAYIMTPKRFDIECLLDAPEKLLGNDIFERLTRNGMSDFKSACRQVALGSPTSSAFHLMRCVEDCLKYLYHAYKKTKRLDKPMWGPMIQELERKKSPRPVKELLDHLTIIRVNFRNPTQHPEKFYSMDEAQDLLNSSIVAINMTCSDARFVQAWKKEQARYMLE